MSRGYTRLAPTVYVRRPAKQFSVGMPVDLSELRESPVRFDLFAVTHGYYQFQCCECLDGWRTEVFPEMEFIAPGVESELMAHVNQTHREKPTQ